MKYLEEAQRLLDLGTPTDGCTTPFKTYIHRWLKKSKLLCAAHDFGGLGLIDGVAPGIHNNIMMLVAHLLNRNPVYWLWGLLAFLVTLPWAVWRHDLSMDFIPLPLFHILLAAGIGLYFLISSGV